MASELGETIREEYEKILKESGLMDKHTKRNVLDKVSRFLNFYEQV